MYMDDIPNRHTLTGTLKAEVLLPGMLRFLFIVGISLAALAPGGARAQAFPTIVPPSAIQATPSSPAPGEKTVLQAVTPIFDKDTTFFEWTLNGQFRSDLSGRGKNTVEVTAGPLGSSISASVRATATDSRTTTASISIRVTDLALVWHADTSSPLWYRGKALASPKSKVTVTALPEILIGGKLANPKNLLYQWSLGDNKKYASGVGKQSIDITTSSVPGGSHWVRVTVEDIGKTIKKEGSLFILNKNPSVSIYRYSAVGGPEFRSAQSIVNAGKGDVLNFIAEPFFFPGKKKDVSFQWNVGGAPIETTVSEPSLLTIETANIPAASLLVSAIASLIKNTSFLPVSTSISIFIR